MGQVIPPVFFFFNRHVKLKSQGRLRKQLHLMQNCHLTFHWESFVSSVAIIYVFAQTLYLDLYFNVLFK